MNKILIIDDEKPTLSMFRLFLGAFGYDVCSAGDGESGISVFESERPSIVFTDIKMPGMDGLSVLEQIKKVDPKAEVIVITGHGDMDLTVRALDLGATDFINKPVRREALEAALKRAESRIEWKSGESRISSGDKDGIPAILVEGTIDGKACSVIDRELEVLERAGSLRVLIDLHPSFSINSEGIKNIIEILSDREAEVFFTGLSVNFIQIFQLVGVSKYARLFETAEDALGKM